MAEALENLQAVQEAHRKEVTQVQEAANQQSKALIVLTPDHYYTHLPYSPVVRREVEALQRSVQEKSGEARQLQRQLADLERDRHTEVVKLRLEASSWLGVTAVYSGVPITLYSVYSMTPSY